VAADRTYPVSVTPLGKEGVYRLLLKPQITMRKDHKGHKDRRILTEANEGLSNAKLDPGRKPLRYLL
jgi:hypothetical protein